eukprot:TRINITY_DN1819_c0_g1_i1.p1 TRINITY_DN1819_c0_g1~~TRINITY_DN1819_c0_g1_i1.p1  ORF type:complete len:621 (-),score=71.82 TRINITY_DN1819_c0_g1_i1:831-2606(-)
MFRSLLQADATSPAPEDDNEGVTDLESVEALAVLTQIVLLMVTLVVGRWLEKKGIYWMSEAGFALLLGIFVGFIAKMTQGEDAYVKSIDFKTDFFFIVLLPPIIFEAGFSLDVGPFFRNIGGVCLYAFAGTTISAFVIGLIMFIGGLMNWIFQLKFLEALLFGSIISATDPVTVLAVFSKLGAQEDLYSLVFGESVMNDAVAIVLYGTIKPFLQEDITAASVFIGIIVFIITFIGSMVIGVIVAFLTALLLKNKYFRHDHHPLESGLVALAAYGSYYIAEGCQFWRIKLSGIVSILFCGIAMAKYTRPNMSKSEYNKVEGLFKIVATLSETFVFIYIGTSLFLEKQAWDSGLTWGFIFLSFIALAISRAANIYPITALVNYIRPPTMRISSNMSFMMWFAGLRGAIAFALSLESSEDMDAEPASVIKTTTFFICLLTVLINGGGTEFMLKKLDLFKSYNAFEEEGDVELTNMPGEDDDDEDDDSPKSPIGRVRSFLKQGGISRTFRPLDKHLSKVLIRPPTQNESQMNMELQKDHLRDENEMTALQENGNGTPQEQGNGSMMVSLSRDSKMYNGDIGTRKPSFKDEQHDLI